MSGSLRITLPHMRAFTLNQLQVIALYLLVAAMLPAEVLYQDSFDGDTLAVNSSGIGGGAVNRTMFTHAWTDDGDATFVPTGTSYTRRALLYSANTFQSDTGFKLTVRYTTGSVGNTAAHNLSFGLISGDTDLSTYGGFNPFRVDTSVYSIGANVTEDQDVASQGLNFTNGSTVTTLDQSGTRAQFQAGETCEVTIEIGKGGYWCYRINGEYEASGVLADGFDLTKEYHVVVYGQDDNGGGKAIESIQLESGYANGERAAHIKGTWSGGSTVVWQMADFKTHDTKQVTFNSGASESALHFAQSKILEIVDPSLTIVPTWGDLSQDEPENDIMLAKILEIREAGFYVKGYSNCKNLTGVNGETYEAAVAAWQSYCDTDPEIQAFIDSQPFHRGVWDSESQTYIADADGDGEDDYPERKYMFCYAEYVLKDYSLRYGSLIDEWIFDSADDMPANGDSDSSGIIEEQRIYQAFTNAIHAGNPEIPVAYNNGRSTVNYNSFPFAAAVQFEDFTFGHAYGGNNDHASEDTGTLGRNYNHVLRMMETDGYVHDGGAWTWDDLIVGNYHSKVATTKWEDGPTNAWEGKENVFLQWNLEALTAGGSMTWGGSTYVSQGATQVRPWAYELLKLLDDHLAQYQNPGAPNWTRARTILPEAIIGQVYYHVLEEEKDFWDPEGDVIDAVWTQTGAPVWLSISQDPNDASRWIMSGIPTEAEVTSHEFSLQVRDVNLEARSREVELEVIENSVTFDNTDGGAPVWISSTLSLPDAYKREAYEYLLKRGQDFEDFDGDTLTMTVVAGVSWLSLEQVASDIWKLSGTPDSSNAGLNTIQLELSDGSQSTSASLQITVTDAQYLSMETNSINGGAYWTTLPFALGTADELSYSNSGNNYDYRSLMYSSETFQSDGGFTLTINYTTGTIDSILGHNFSFGLISADTDVASYAGFNPFAADTSVYSLGVNVIENRGLNFTDGSSVTTLDQSGSNVDFVAGTSTEVIIEVGPNGAWTYSINGIEEASGVIAEGFDLSKEYYVAVYGQDDNGNGKSIQSIALDLNTAPLVGMLAEWNFDAGTSSAVLDSTAHSFDAIAYNGTLVSGLVGQGMSFNGSSSYVDLPVEAVSLISNEITVSMWVNGDATQPAAETILSAIDSSGNRVLNIHLPWSSSKVIWDAGNSGGTNYDRISKDAFASEFMGRWNHWVFTKSATSGEMEIYLNGSLWHSGTGKARSMDGMTAAFLGSGDGQSHYSGIIDEVKLYNIALSPDEISELYNAYEGYEAWTSRHPNLEEMELIADADQDGITSLLEYTLNGSPLEADQVILPTLDTSGASFVFTFTRRSESASDTSQVFQYSSNLLDWYDLNITGDRASEVSVVDAIDDTEDVTVTVSKDLAVEGRLFGRLQVVAE
ncbi:LamG-like jellyroll fold domain-containing protein [Lentimonas sp. CC4]|uniref:LamG-like jellyroll fold domain-containing protein n=1 Tax=Lentimonas sp. CC4 TaxID=2676099 RepID=UPI001389A96B|nr:LamG-like jellyroll fold domain-containing protein [Lentimonas sp. CC4]